MANEQDRIELLKLIKKLQQEIVSLEEEQASISKEELKTNTELQKKQKELVSRARELKKVNEEIRQLNIQYLEHQKDQQDRIRSIADQQFFIKDIEKERLHHYNSINTSVTGNLEKFNEMADVNIELASLSAEQTAEAELLREKHRSIANSVDMRGQGTKEQLAILQKQNDMAYNYAMLSDRTKDVLEGQRQVLLGINKTIQGVVETARTLVSGPMGMLGSVLIGAGFALEHLGHVAHETGTFFTEMSLSAAGLGFIFKDATGVAMGLAHELGSIEEATFGIQLKTNMIAHNMGLSGDQAASLVGSFSRLNEGSADVALDMMQFTQNLAKANNVAPTAVMQDIAGSAEAFAKYGKDGGENIARAAVAARSLGVNMATVEGISDNLLDFESSITKELELSAMLGRNINLNRARALAYEGELGAATKETLRQLGGVDAFNRMDVFQKKQSADLLGISVAELQKMADNYDRLNDDGSLQLTTTEAIGAKFDWISQSLKGIATGPGGDFLKMLGGAAVAAGQMGFDIAGMTKNLGKKVWSKVGAIFGKKSGGTKSVAEEVMGGGKKESPTEQLSKASGGKKGFNATNMLKGAAAILVLSAALYVAAKAFQEFATVEWESVAKGVAGLAGLAGIAYLLGKMKGNLVEGAFAIGLLGAAIIPFAFAMKMMKDVGLESIAVLAGGLLTLGVAAAILGSFVPLMLMGALAIAALGVSMIAFGGGIMMVASGMEKLFSSFSNIGSIIEQLSPLVGMVGPIFALAGAITSLGMAMAFLGIAGLPGLAILSGVAALSEPLTAIAKVFGFGSGETGAVEEQSLSEYETQMLSKMDQLIQAVNKNRDVYLDKEKVTNVVVKTSERKSENIWGLGVA